MKFGVREGMLTATFETVHKVAGELGFDGVELEVGPNVPDDGTPLFCPDGRADLVERMDATGVATSCVCVGALWSYGPTESDPALRQTGLELLTETIKACGAIGTGCILAPLTNADLEADAAVARWVEFLNEVKGTAEDCGVTVALEACCRAGMATDTDTIALVEAVGSPRVLAYLDVANIRMGGTDSVQAVRSLAAAGCLAHIHMKDLLADPPDSDRKWSVVDLDAGGLDFAGIRDAILDVGYDGWLTIETPGGDDLNASAKRNLETLKGYFE